MSRLLIVIVVGISTMRLGYADPSAADRAVADADARARAKDFVGAAAKFREAYAADPRPELICNVGVAYYKAQELPRAQLFLSRCLERGTTLDAKFIDVVRGTLAKLQLALQAGNFTPVDIVVEPRFATVAIDAFAADETFDGGRTVWLAYGAHRVTVRAAGHQDRTVDVDAHGHAVSQVRVNLERTPEVAAPVVEPPVSAEPAVPAGPPSPVVDPPAPVLARPSLAPPVIASVATVGLAIVAVYARGQASDHADRAKLAASSEIYRREADDVRSWNTIFGVDLAITGVAAVASGYLWYRVVRSPSRSVAPRVEASGQGASFAIAGTF